MISECLEGINEPTDIYKFYNQESPNSLPSLLICNDIYQQQSTTYSTYIFDNNNNKPLYIKNQSNAGDLQKGYAKNIDVESELKWINHISDECFYDKYKMDLKKTPSLNQHYKKVFKPQEERLNDMKIKKINDKDFIDQNCLDKNDITKSFKECNIKPNKNSPFPNNNKSTLIRDSQQVKYQFHNNKYIDCYPCEALFNNFTKRGGILNNISRENPYN